MAVEALMTKSYDFMYANADSSLYFAIRSLSQSLDRRDFQQIGRSHHLKGRAHWQNNETQKALKEYGMAFWYYESQRNDYRKALLFQHMSQVYIDQGRYEDGRIALERALHIGRGLQNTELLARLTHSLGLLFHIIGQMDNALAYHRQSLRINQERSHQPAISANYNNLGNVFMKEGHLDSALYYYRAAFALKDSIEDARGRIFSLSNIGNVLNEMDSLAQAEAVLSWGVKESEEEGMEPWGVLPRLNLAYTFELQGRHGLAVKTLDRLLEDSLLTSPSERMTIHENLAKNYEMQGRYAKANSHLRVFKAYNDSLNSMESASQFLQMEQRLIAGRQARSLRSLKAQKALQDIRFENRTLWLYILLTLALIVTVLAISFYVRFRIKRRAHAEQAAVNKMRSRFFANIAHEFKTPIGLILGPLARLREEPGIGADAQDWLDISQTNGRQLLDLTHQLLDLSRLELGKMPLRLADTHLVSLFQSSFRSFKPMADREGISMAYEGPESGWWVRMDGQALQKIINNLLSNALRHTPEGGEVTMEVSLKGAEGQSLSKEKGFAGLLGISISDTGEGIPQEQLERIFQPFYQAESMHNHQGSGIGLSLVRELVELQDGKIEVESVMGEGSRFEIELPVAAAWREEVEEAEPISVEMAEGEAPLVLVVDDHQDYRRMVKEELVKGYRVLEAANGKAALDLARTHPVDLVVTDLMMPEMDGLELCTALKSALETSHLPVVVLTGWEDEETRLKGLSIGADAYLQKPAPAGEIHIRVSSLIGQRRALQERWSREPKTAVESMGASGLDKEFLEKARRIVLENISDSAFDVKTFCKAMGMSRPQLFRKVKALTGQNISEFIRSIRLRKAAELLQNTKGNVSDIAYRVGFGNPSYFSRCFKQLYGTSPKDFAAKSAG